jgi:3-mercaptopyruvate sulfurtransferase SseA
MLKAPKAIAATFAAVGVDPSKRILLYCGVGMPASFDAVLRDQLGYRNMAVWVASTLVVKSPASAGI